MLRKIVNVVLIAMALIIISVIIFFFLGLWSQLELEKRVVAECRAQGGIVMEDAMTGPYCREERKEESLDPEV